MKKDKSVREQFIASQVAAGAEIERGSGGRTIDNPSADMWRTIALLVLNKEDQEIARLEANHAEELRLIMERCELNEALQTQSWFHRLAIRYGDETTHKLIAHQIEPGMTLEHLAASFGVPEPDCIYETPDGITHISYGDMVTGCHFEAQGDFITVAKLGSKVTFPDYVYNLSNNY